MIEIKWFFISSMRTLEIFGNILQIKEPFNHIVSTDEEIKFSYCNFVPLAAVIGL